MCPAITEEGINICKTDKNCKNKCPYRYGDTKEQLIRKVAQIIEKNIKKKYIDVFVGRSGYFIRTEELAKEIVEFLGAEDAR